MAGTWQHYKTVENMNLRLSNFYPFYDRQFINTRIRLHLLIMDKVWQSCTIVFLRTKTPYCKNIWGTTHEGEDNAKTVALLVVVSISLDFSWLKLDDQLTEPESHNILIQWNDCSNLLISIILLYFNLFKLHTHNIANGIRDWKSV